MPHSEASVAAVRVAVAGCGYWGANLVRNFAALGSLSAVVDSDPDKAAAASESAGVPARSWGQVLSDADIDGVVIATPAVTHSSLVAEALHAGKDVFVEKPLALHVLEAEALAALAEERGRILMVGHLMRYHPAFLRLQELVDEGALGQIRYVYSNRLNFGKFRREENILWSFAPHDVSMILSLVGQEPDGVTAVGATFLQKVVADVTTTHLTFPGGQAAHIFVSWLHPVKEQRLVVVGDKAMAVLDDGQGWDGKLVLFRHQVAWRNGVPLPDHAEAETVALKEEEPLRLECQHFLDCVTQRVPPRTDGWEGVRVLRVLDQAESAMRSAAAHPGTAGDHPEDVSIHPTAVVDEPSEIGHGTKVWHFTHILAGTKIGRDCVLGQNVMVGPDVIVGDGCKIQNNVSIYKGVELEDGVFCGPSAVFTNVRTPRAEVDRKDDFDRTLVQRGASIGANATIVCGNSIGEYATIAAGAVVTADVPAHALMAGVPARHVGWVSHAGERLDDSLQCPRTGQRYAELDKETLVEISVEESLG